MVEDNRHDTTLVDWESEGGHAAPPAAEPVQAAPSAAELDRVLGPRNRRGSLGPAPAASPVGDTASDAVLRTHLAVLLDAFPPSVPAAQEPAGPAGESHEDLERAPDGIPHAVIALTVVFSMLTAVVLIGLFLAGDTVGKIAAVALAIIAVPMLVFRLGAKAERDRDHDHPSR